VLHRGLADQILGRRSSMTVGETDTPLHVVVRAENAARARDLLGDLGTGAVATAVPPAPTPPRTPVAAAGEATSSGDVELSNVETGAPLGRLTMP